MSNLNAFPVGPEGEAMAERQRRFIEDREGREAMTNTEDEVEALRAARRAEQIRIAREEAWDEGWNSGFRDMQSAKTVDGYVEVTPTTNPYRQDAHD